MVKKEKKVPLTKFQLIAEGFSEFKGPNRNPDFYSQHKSEIDHILQEITALKLN